MKIGILAVGKVKEQWLKAAVAEYQKRISRFADVTIVEVPDAPEQVSLAKSLRQEGEALLKRWPGSGMTVALDVHGRRLDSPGLAVEQQKWLELGGSQLTYVIAGSNGFDPAVLEKVQARLSLSDLTFPHQLSRLILLEQIFRSFKINNGETYHK